VPSGDVPGAPALRWLLQERRSPQNMAKSRLCYEAVAPRTRCTSLSRGEGRSRCNRDAKLHSVRVEIFEEHRLCVCADAGAQGVEVAPAGRRVPDAIDVKVEFSIRPVIFRGNGDHGAAGS